MKNTALLSLLVFFSLGLKAADKLTDSFVIIGEKTFYCDKVHVGMGSTRIYIDGKQILKVPTFAINAYAENGMLYEYLPVLTKDQDTVGWAFMQFIASRNGSRIYRYCSDCLHYDPVNEKIAPTMPVYRYYTFKRGNFVSVSDDENVKEHLASFGVRII